MNFQQELTSWKSPVPVKTAPVPTVGSKAPSLSKLQLPRADGRSTVITFLRHCGCPFAEKTFKQLAHLSNKHPEVAFVAVSHSDQSATEKWIVLVGGEWSVEVVIDTERELYAKWGLGISSTWHVINPWSVYNGYRLAKDEKIWNKPTESGTRWQTGGSFAMDGEGIVRWIKVPKTSDEIPDFRDALQALGLGKDLEHAKVSS